jgi:uncharacterized phage infection (PIP) family protein YhgE
MADQNFKITISAFDKTKGAFNTATAGIRRVAGAVLSLKTAILGAVGVTGIGLLVKNSLDATDQLAKTASKIGTTTEALSALRYAAERTGVSTQTMDMALQRFVRRTAEAAVGTGEAKGAIRELGLDARELVKLPLDKRMLVLSNAFGKVENESDKLRLAFKLFDSEGAALVNTLGEGSEGLQALFNDADALGLVMTESAASGVEAASDSLTRLKGLMTGFTNQTIAALAPALKSVTDEFVKLGLAAADGDVQNIGQVIAKSITEGLITFIEGLEEFFNAISAVVNQINKVYRKLFPTEERKRIEADIEAITDKLARPGQQLRPENFDRLSDGAKKLVLKYRELKAELDALDDQQAKTFDFSGLVEKLRNVTNEIGNNTDAVNDNNDANKNGQETTSAWRAVFAKVGKDIPTVSDQLQDLANTASGAITQGFTDAITGAKNFGEAMRNMAKTVVDALLKMVIQEQITAPLMKIISSAFSPKAIGGSVQAGQPYMVGERGAEMFVPNQSGTIIPNNKLGGSGTVINQTINVSTGVQQTVRAEITNLMPQIANATKAAVADARMRGGSYSKALIGV